jgi:hypothetical protein
MLRIIVESSNSKEPAVQWMMDMLRFKQVGYKIRAAKKVGEGIVYMTVFEKSPRGKNSDND